MDIKFMEEAYKQAQKAYQKDEVPIGAVIVCDGKVLARAYNTRNKTQNAINHAEILVISKACKKLKSWRLENCDIYITLEPCPMCLGAIQNARIKNLYFGAYDKTSSSDLFNQIITDKRLNHKCNFIGGIMEDECSSLLTKFFCSKRKGE